MRCSCYNKIIPEAQRIEQLGSNEEDAGSIPVRDTECGNTLETPRGPRA